jgi:hypothetical protein
MAEWHTSQFMAVITSAKEIITHQGKCNNLLILSCEKEKNIINASLTDDGLHNFDFKRHSLQNKSNEGNHRLNFIKAQLKPPTWSLCITLHIPMAILHWHWIHFPLSSFKSTAGSNGADLSRETRVMQRNNAGLTRKDGFNHQPQLKGHHRIGQRQSHPWKRCTR